MTKISATHQCFVKKDDKYLMLHRNETKTIMPDVWMAPGGHVELEEGVYEATHREMMEETGLEIQNLKIKAVGSVMLKDIDRQFYLHLIVADYKSGEVIDSDDGELKWLTADEIAELPNLLAELKPIIKDVLEGDAIVSYKATYSEGNNMESFTTEKN